MDAWKKEKKKKRQEHENATLMDVIASSAPIRALTAHFQRRTSDNMQKQAMVSSSTACTETKDSKPIDVASIKQAELEGNATAPLTIADAAVVRWEWCSDNLVWSSYSPSLSLIIEAASQSGKSEIKIHVGNSSYTVSFQPTGPRQKNLTTGRTRPVKRDTTEQGTGVSWLWWESETHRWHKYEAVLEARIEGSWKDCNIGKTAVGKENAPAGLFFTIHHHAYAIEYEIDAVQYNVNTRYARGVRRCSCPPQSTGLSFEGQVTSIADMRDCSPANSQSSKSHTISPCSNNACYQAQPQSAHIGDCNASSSQSSNSQTMLPCLNNTCHRPHPESRADLLGSDVGDGVLERPTYNSAGLVDYLSPLETEDCSICLCSLQEKRAVSLSKCEHSFHSECIELWFQNRPRCPECLTVYGTIIGTQPPGDMHVEYIKYGSKGDSSRLAGFPKIDVIRITYRFPSGIQTAQHPKPGRPYAGTTRIAYLPKNRDGEEVLELLRKAWKQRLLFCVGTSVTTGQSDVVTWSGIHHKTCTSGGSSNHGYPDETYFSRVKKELEDSGVELVMMERGQ